MLRDKDPRFKGLEIKIGVMVAAALAGIIFIIALVGIEKDLFTAKYRVYFISDSGSGFIQGMPVKLSGFKIGRVKRLGLTTDARVRVDLEINRKYDKWIKAGSVARLAKEGFIGDSFVELTTGTGRVISDGEMIPYEKAGGIEELVEQAKPVLTEVKDIIHYANSPEGDIKASLRNIRELTGELRETRKALDAALKNTGRFVASLDEKSSATLASAERAMKNVEALTGRLGPVMEKVEEVAGRAHLASERLPGSIDKIDEILENVRAVSEALAKETPRMREILINAEEAAREGKRIARGVRQSWPVRLMVPEPAEPGLVPLDGYLFETGARQSPAPTEAGKGELYK